MDRHEHILDVFVFKKSAEALGICKALTGQAVLIAAQPWATVDSIVIALPIAFLWDCNSQPACKTTRKRTHGQMFQRSLNNSLNFYFFYFNWTFLFIFNPTFLSLNFENVKKDDIKN